MSTLMYLYKASLTNPEKDLEYYIWNNWRGWLSWGGFHKYSLEIDTETRIVHFRIVNGVNGESRMRCKFPLDISTEEEYFQYSLMYEIPFSMDEFNEIKHILDIDYVMANKL